MPNPNIEEETTKYRKCPILGSGEIGSAYPELRTPKKKTYMLSSNKGGLPYMSYFQFCELRPPL